jgi:hypothetical protein
VLAGAGTAVALAGGGKPDALQVADPTPTATGAVAVPAAYLPTPEDATRAAGGTWDPGVLVTDQGLLLHVCPQGEGFSEPGVSRFLENGNAGALTFVTELPTGHAQAWVEKFRQAAIDCPRRAADSEDGKASNSFDLLGIAANDGLVLRDTYRDCDSCPASVTLWIALASDAVLSVTQLTDSPPDPGGWIDVLRDRLDHPVANPPTPTATPSPTVTPVEPVTDAPLSGGDLLQVDRIGPVVVGMTLEEARDAAQVELRQEGDLLGNCVFYTPRSGRPDVSFMVIDGIVSRIDVDEPSTTSTQEGIRIGSSEADVKLTYPSTTVSKHYYTDGHYLRVLSQDGKTAYLFETDGTRVVNFRSGFPSAVDAPEGCA